jgi:hypothetical protein
MKTLQIAAAALAALALAGCLDVTEAIHTDIEVSQSLTLDLSGDCTGVGEQDGATYQKRVDGTDCVIDIQWAGPVLDLSEVRDKVATEAPKYDVDPATAKLSEMEFTVVEAYGYDANGARLDAFPSPALDAALYFEEIEAMTMSDTVVGGGLFDLFVEVPEAAVAIAHDAFAANRPVNGSVVATLRIPLEAMAAIQAQPGPVTIEIAADVHVTALVSKSLL